MSANVTWPVLAQCLSNVRNQGVYIRDRRAIDFLGDCRAVDSIRGGLPAVYPNHES